MTTYPRTITSTAGVGTSINAADITVPDDELLDHINGLIGGQDDYNNLRGKVQEATIASGVVTATYNFLIVDTEGAASTDDLVTINGAADGVFLFIKMADAARVVTLKHGSGNLTLVGGTDKALSATAWRCLCGIGSNWGQVEFS